MVEVKSVKVDNWGVFFLQKLQNFFNKTHYCDLTLQFKDNSQLKVHRLVLSACTDFFNVLETQYNVQDDILVMPKDLQADVVVPIVNFMYTGTLEFEVNMYPRLLKTAKDMNMTVLLKLLDAHKRTVGESLRQQQKAPVVLNKGVVGNNQRVTYSRSTTSTGATQRTYTTQRRAAQTTSKPVVSSRGGGSGSGGGSGNSSSYGGMTAAGVKIKTEKSPISVMRTSVPSTSYIRKNLPEPVQLVAKYAASGSVKGPSRFECTDDANADAFESSFDNISYESKPLITSKDDHDDATFEKIKRTVSGAVKRGYSTNSSIASPPEKKPNIEEIKEYTEAHRMRKEIVAQEVDEELDYYAEDFQNADDDDDDENGGGDSNTGSVVIKSESGGAVNHAKIISEVLKKYPHLVKNNKNIKLKILQKGNSPVTVSAITKDPTTISTSKQQAAAKQSKAITVQSKIPAIKSDVTAASKVATRSTAVATSAPQAAPAIKAAAPGSGQPKKIDSRTMHALIAKGAENMTGPWLCLDCGMNGRPISIPSYRSFRRHLVNIHKQKIDPRICEYCGHRANKRNDFHYHILIKHNIKPPNDLQFPKCGLCTFIALDQLALRKHKEEDHQSHGQQLCIYCNETFQKEIQLYSHMRNKHKERAQEDGVMDFSDEETYDDDTDKYVPNHPEATQAITVVTTTAGNGGGGNGSGVESKIKVLSNITLPSKGQFIIDSQGAANVLVATSTENIALEPSSEAEAMSNVASGIATSLAVLDTDAQLEGAESYEEALQSQYIEAAMADVHGEILKKEDDDDDDDDGDGTQVVTKFITEEGSELELTAAQKAQLLEQLQGQEGQLSENVVMVLDASFEHASTESDVNNASTDGMDVDQQSQQSVEEEIVASKDDSTEDEMASIENASADEDSQQEASNIHEQDAASIDDEQDGGAVAQEPQKIPDDEKAKLLSALEGDWSEEDEQQQQQAEQQQAEQQQQQQQQPIAGKKTKSNVAKVDESKQTAVTAATATAITAKTKRSNKKIETDTIKIEKGNNDSAKTILDDWDTKFEEESEKSAHEEKVDTDADETDAGAEQTTDKSADVDSKNSGGGGSANNKSDKKQLDGKSEIKTLINDWGDEDEEAY